MKRSEMISMLEKEWQNSAFKDGKEIIIEKGRSIDIEQMEGIFLIKEGWCASVLTDINGKLKVDNIFSENELVFTDLFHMYIHLSDQKMYLHTLTNCVIYKVPINKALGDTYRDAQIQYLIQMWKNKNKLNFMNGKEKLEWFSSLFPSALNVISHKYIASFLGMDPVSLSRMIHRK